MSRDWLFKEEYIPKGKVGCELGVHFGNLSQTILTLSNPSKLYLVDPWSKVEGHDSPLFGTRSDSKELDRIHSVVVNRFKNNPRVEILREFNTNTIPRGTLDWIYVDGDHSYSGTYYALVDAYRCTTDDGIIAGDDYNTNGWWSGQVIEAVNQFIRDYKVQVVTIQRNQFVLKKQKE
jgi:hypothetical protein